MRTGIVVLAVAIAWGGASTVRGQEAASGAATAAEDKESAYAAELAKRADGVLKDLHLTDDAKAARVRERVIQQYRDLRTVHEARDAKLRAKEDKQQIRAETEDALKPVHEKFLADLSAELTPEQVEAVKDKMTYNVVKVTYDAFRDMLPQLTDVQKAYILAQLKDARESAMDQGTSQEKHAVFDKYKGRINNYLSKEGYDLKKANQEWAERRKAREATAKQ